MKELCASLFATKLDAMYNGVGHQEVVGQLTTFRWEHPVIIITQGWPSWSFCADSLGCLNLITWCVFSLPKSKLELCASQLSSSLVNGGEEALKLRIRDMKHMCVLIQGGASFTN